MPIPEAQQAEIERILCDIQDPIGAGPLREMLGALREGAGEDRLVEILSALAADAGAPRDAESLVRLARALLTIGVRPRGRGWRKRKMGADLCTICEKEVEFCWSCPCGFRICQACLDENIWGMTCNNVTWECPDCGAIRSF